MRLVWFGREGERVRLSAPYELNRRCEGYQGWEEWEGTLTPTLSHRARGRTIAETACEECCQRAEGCEDSTSAPARAVDSTASAAAVESTDTAVDSSAAPVESIPWGA